MKTKFILVILSQLLITSCGGIQKARYFTPEAPTAGTQSWGDGLAAADGDICVWVRDETAMYLPLMAGPIGVPFFPLGILSSTPERLGYFDLAVWIVPELDQHEKFRFDPRETTIRFTNGVTSKPSTVQISRFKTDWGKEKVYLIKPDIVENIKYPEHLGPKSLFEVTQPAELWNWSRFTMRFEKPSKDIAPMKVEIRGISSIDGTHKLFAFNFREVQKYRYLISGQEPSGESMGSSPATPCRELFKAIKKGQEQNLTHE